MLVCNGQCTVQSSGIRLVANDQTKLAVRDDAKNFDLYLSEGRVDFTVTSAERTISFYTPEGTYTTAGVIFSASAEPAVRGWAQVGPDGATEIGVTEGKMVFTTANGEKIVDANHKIQLAAADIPDGALVPDSNYGAAAVAGGARTNNDRRAAGAPPWLGGGAFGLGVVTVLAVALFNDGSGDGATNVSLQPDSSPSPPASPVTGGGSSDKKRPAPPPSASPAN
ncbi:MAG: hypothetical protein GX087_07540 [Desulfobulbaceae bacterium]|nr:hypothetical protein [Desulfobulbaceae bacterium]